MASLCAVFAGYRSSFLLAVPLAALLGLVSLAEAQDASSNEEASNRQLIGDEDSSVAVARAALFESLARDVEQLEKQSNVLKKVVQLVSPTVVHIEAQKANSQAGVRYGPDAKVEEAGSGFIIHMGQRFYVVTNRHVVKSAQPRNITIRLSDGRQLTPDRVLGDPETDVAVLRIPAMDLHPSRIGNSDQTEIGDFVVAVGSPFGLSQSITFGIISAKGRRDLELGDDNVRFQDFMQTDAAINPGNSGGPLINLRGEVVGMNTAIASSSGGNEGIGFTIPVNMVMVVARQLIERGTVVRAFLGVKLKDNFGPSMAMSVGLKQPRGALVISVTPNSPAAAAGMKNDDVVLEFNGVRVDDDSHLINLVSMAEVGKEIPVVVFREKKVTRLTVKTAPAPPKLTAR
jgi:serine protease Do